MDPWPVPRRSQSWVPGLRFSSMTHWARPLGRGGGAGDPSAEGGGFDERWGDARRVAGDRWSTRRSAETARPREPDCTAQVALITTATARANVASERNRSLEALAWRPRRRSVGALRRRGPLVS